MTTWTLSNLSTEWVGPITVTRNGDPVTGWTLGIFPRFYRPATVAEIDEAPSELDGGLGVLVGPGTGHVLNPGTTYRLWIRFADNPEAPVLNDVGELRIT